MEFQALLRPMRYSAQERMPSSSPMDNPADVLPRNDGVQSMDISDFALDGWAADFGARGKVNVDSPQAPVLGQDLYRAAKKATGSRNQDCISVHAYQFLKLWIRTVWPR